MMSTTNQLLITGCYRSGTEYITQLLNNHPKLSATMYATNFMRYYYNRYNPISERYIELIHDAHKTIHKRHGIFIDKNEILAYICNQKEITYAKIYDAIMSNTFLGENHYWAEKTQLVWREIPDFLKMFPTGKAINIIRDPRAVLSSFKKHTYAEKPLYLGAIFNCYDSMKHSQHFQEQYPNRFLQVQYEDIILNPKHTLKNIFSFLNLSAGHELLSEEGWKNTDGSPWKHNSAFIKDDQAYKKSRPLNEWKNHLTDLEVLFCELINGELMNKNNYTLTRMKEIQYLSHPTIERYLELWCDGKGIEEFPTDPLKEENWSENR